MPSAEPYDAVVIGSADGGKYLAWHLAEAGQKTAVIEHRFIGGSCPNVNCLPQQERNLERRSGQDSCLRQRLRRDH